MSVIQTFYGSVVCRAYVVNECTKLQTLRVVLKAYESLVQKKYSVLSLHCRPKMWHTRSFEVLPCASVQSTIRTLSLGCLHWCTSLYRHILKNI